MIRVGDPYEFATFSGDQNNDGEFAAEDRHLAVFNVATMFHDELGNFLDQTNLIRSDRGQNKMSGVCHNVFLLVHLQPLRIGHVTWNPFMIASYHRLATEVATPCGSSGSV